MPFTQSQNPTSVTVQTPQIELAFALDDGGLRVLRRVGGPNVLGHGAPRATLDLQVGVEGTWLAERVFVRYLRHSVAEHADDIELVIVIGIGPLMVYDRYRITGTLIARRISVQNVSEDEIQLRRVRLALPWARIGEVETCRFEAPGNSTRPRIPLSVAAQQRRAVSPRTFFTPGTREGRALEPAPTHAPGLLALYDPLSSEALLCWYHSEVEPAQPQIEGNDSAVTLIHEVELADRLRSQVALNGGTQYILLLREPWLAALAAFRRTLALTGVRPAIQPVAWVRDAAIYETHPAEFGGFAGLTAALDRLAALGINTLCLLPIWAFDNRRARLWDGNWRDSGNPYAITDFEQLDPTLGTPDDLRALVAAAHTRAMRVLVDLPLSGYASSARYVAEHPDWFCRDEAGALVLLPGGEGLGCLDWASDDLHRYVVQQAHSQAQTYDLDGYRAVPPRTAPANWTRRVTTHASAGSLGALRLIERLRAALQASKPDAVLLSTLGGPVYAARTDMNTDELAHHQFIHMGLERVTPAELGEWLGDVQETLTGGAARVCFTENHHTRVLNPIADGLRGSLISHALLAGMILCGFVPLVPHGQDVCDPEMITRLLHARAAYPILRHGQTLYNRIASDSPQVFAVLRVSADQHLVGVINVGPHKRAVTLRLPTSLMGLGAATYTLCDVFSDSQWEEQGRQQWRGDELAALRLTLEPFGAYALLVQVAPPVVETEEAAILQEV